MERVPKYVRLAPIFAAMRDKGASVSTIASVHDMAWSQAREILHFAKTGELPRWNKRRKRKQTRPATPPNYLEIASEVTRMRDEGNAPFTQIAAKMRVSPNTVRRAYDHAHREQIRQAAERGEPVQRGQWSHLGEEKYQRIRQMLRAEVNPAEIASAVCCGPSTVYRERRKMRQ